MRAADTAHLRSRGRGVFQEVWGRGGTSGEDKGVLCFVLRLFVCVCDAWATLSGEEPQSLGQPVRAVPGGVRRGRGPRLSANLERAHQGHVQPNTVAYLSHPSPAWYADYPLLVLAAQDGAAFCIVANEAFVHANKLENRAIELVTMGLATDYPDAFVGRSAMNGADRWLWDDVTSGSKIFTQAGPSWDDVGVVELHNCFSASEARAEFTLV